MVNQPMINKKLLIAIIFLLKAYIIVKLKINLSTVLLVNMICIAMIDLIYKIIPNILLASMVFDFIMARKTIIFREHIQLFILITLILVIINSLKEDIFYGGDIKLMGVSTLYLGPEVIKVFALTGIINIIFLMAFRKKEVPLGPSVLLAIILMWSG